MKKILLKIIVITFVWKFVMRRPDENTLVVSLVEGPEILNGLKITRKFSEDGLQMVRSIALFDINNDAVNDIIYLDFVALLWKTILRMHLFIFQTEEKIGDKTATAIRKFKRIWSLGNKMYLTNQLMIIININITCWLVNSN